MHEPPATAVALLKSAQELVRLSRQARAHVQATCDETRLTRAWSQELRQRAMRCANCHHRLEATDTAFSVGYMPVGETFSGGTMWVHRRCLVHWIAARLRSDPGRDTLPT